MLKKIFLAIGLSLLISGPAFATCADPLPITSGGGSPGTVNMSVSQNTADGGCQYNTVPMQNNAPITVTNPSFNAITDGTNGVMAIKPASTAPAAADKAAVVGISPNTGEVGTPATGVTQPTGGVGISGWLSGIYTTVKTWLANQATNGATTTHTCAVSGFSELGCLGQIDDDVKSPPTLGTSGGWSRTLFTSISTTVQTVKSSAGQLAKLYCDNPNATPIYVETFDVSGTVTLGTTAPTQAYYVAANSAQGFALPVQGDQYSNAIKLAAVTSVNGTAAPSTPGNCNVSWN